MLNFLAIVLYMIIMRIFVEKKKIKHYHIIDDYWIQLERSIM